MPGVPYPHGGPDQCEDEAGQGAAGGDPRPPSFHPWTGAFSCDAHQERRGDLLRAPFPREAGHGAEGGMGPLLLPRLERGQPLRVSPFLHLPVRPGEIMGPVPSEQGQGSGKAPAHVTFIVPEKARDWIA